jgi:hypothetical protein
MAMTAGEGDVNVLSHILALFAKYKSARSSAVLANLVALMVYALQTRAMRRAYHLQFALSSQVVALNHGIARASHAPMEAHVP